MKFTTAIGNEFSRNLYRTLSIASALLIMLIAADGVWCGIDTNFPSFYRYTASLCITISQMSYHTHGYVGLVDVSNFLGQHGFALIPDNDAIMQLSQTGLLRVLKTPS